MTTKRLNVLLSFRQPKSAYEEKTFDGRTYRVCPVTLMKEGVWRCSEGSVLYTAEEMMLFCEAWNNKPIVKDHPQDSEGNFILADSIDVLENQKIGFLLNTRVEGKAQKADAWIDVEKAKTVWPDLLDAIDKGDPIEVSTGLVATCEIESGRYAGKRYEYVAREHRPDHLAVLSKTKGACSVADGAGLLVAQSFEADDISPALMEIAVERLDIMLANQLTHNRLRDLLAVQLSEMARNDAKEKGTYSDSIWVEDIVGRKVIAWWGGKLYEVPFKQSADGVTLSAAPPYREVVRVTQYRLVDGTVIGNEKSTDSELEGTSVKKAELISLLIANQVFEETDKQMLEGMTEAKLQSLVDRTKAPEKEKVLANQDKTPPAPAFDYKAFMQQAPVEFQRHVARSMRLANQQFSEDIAAVVSLSDGAYTEAECKDMDPEVISKLHKTLANAAAKAKSSKPVDADGDEMWEGTDFSGAAFAGGRILSNAAEGEDEAPLGLAPATFTK